MQKAAKGKRKERIADHFHGGGFSHHKSQFVLNKEGNMSWSTSILTIMEKRME